MKHYWTEKHQDQVVQYYKAQFQQDCDELRHELFNILYPALVTMAEVAIKSFAKTPEEDDIQDILIHHFTKTLPKLDEQKLQGQLNYLWISTRNYVITYVLNPKKVLQLADLIEQESISEDCQFDGEFDQYEVRNRIIAEIDKMITGQRILNSRNVMFLLLLKAYIIQNDFDVRGFGDYVCDKMKLTTQQYRGVAARLGIKTKVLNEKLIGS